MVEQIKKLCSDNKTSIKALEKELGFGNGTIRRWDKNAPSVERISMVANKFNVPMSYLMGETNDPIDRSKTNWAELEYGQKNNPTSNSGEVDFSDMELLEAFRNADEATQGLIRKALGLK